MANTGYRIKETFGPTVQGEGPHQGKPCVFLRFSGCNAWDGRPATRADSACPYCDTDFFGGDHLQADDILARLDTLRQYKPGSAQWGLVITGGEPLLQLDEGLLALLAEHFPWIDIETNGTRPAPQRPKHVTVVCSPKAITNQPIVVEPDAWKVLIPAQEDLLRLAVASGKPLWLQPLCPDDGPQGPAYEAAMERCLNLVFEHGAQISLQLHKYLGVK